MVGNICSGYPDDEHEVEELELKVLQSGGGYYVGTFCPHCGPYSRDSGYFASEGAAEEYLKVLEESA